MGVREGVPEEVETRTSQIRKTRSYMVVGWISWEIDLTPEHSLTTRSSETPPEALRTSSD